MGGGCRAPAEHPGCVCWTADQQLPSGATTAREAPTCLHLCFTLDVYYLYKRTWRTIVGPARENPASARETQW